MHGTWRVTGFSILPLAVLGIAAGAGAEGAVWLLARFWWVLGSLAASGVLATVAVVRLAAWNDRRAALAWSQRPAQLHAEPVTALPRTERSAAIEQHVHYHLHLAAPASGPAIVQPAITQEVKP